MDVTRVVSAAIAPRIEGNRDPDFRFTRIEPAIRDDTGRHGRDQGRQRGNDKAGVIPTFVLRAGASRCLDLVEPQTFCLEPAFRSIGTRRVGPRKGPNALDCVIGAC